MLVHCVRYVEEALEALSETSRGDDCVERLLVPAREHDAALGQALDVPADVDGARLQLLQEPDVDHGGPARGERAPGGGADAVLPEIAGPDPAHRRREAVGRPGWKR